MSKPIIIIGRSCSGKTRPMRPGEIQDKNYYFRAEQDFAGITYGMVTEVKKNDGFVPVEKIAKQIYDLAQKNREEIIHDKESEDCEK